MLCTDCLHVGAPDTLLPGSDRAEILAWSCFAVPGAVYCWWRHLRREKRCAQCGSGALMRESRASAARRMPQAEPFGGPRIVSLSSGRFVWPTALGCPRTRLRSGGVAAVASAFGFAAWLLGWLDLTPSTHALQAATAGWLVGASWLGFQLQQIARSRTQLPGCEAWDDRGRRLRIERV